MSTRALTLAGAVLLSLLLIFGAVEYRYDSSLAAGSKQAQLNLDAASGQVQQLNKDAALADGAWKTTVAGSVQTESDLSATQDSLSQLVQVSRQVAAQDAQQKQAVDAMVSLSAQHEKDTQDALDSVLSSILGKPIGQTFGERATIKVFSLQAAGYRGYMAKIKLHDPTAVKLVLSHDKVGDVGETTGHAAARTGATLAINGGGFATQGGLLYPMGITVVNGQIRTWSRVDLSFIGFNDQGKLVGGAITKKSQIQALHVQQGATFVPTLLQDGKKIPIPARYANRKEPRTLIGHFSNGDILMIVIDGREYGYSTGITLEDAQDKLLEFKVRDAYNLDGGGSSTFVYNGKVLNHPSDGHERLLASNFVIFK